jgi:type II secretory pathway component PulK
LGNGMLDPNEDDGAATWPADNADGRIDYGLIDYFTVYGDEKVNLNTASAEVLAALQGIEAEDVQAILDYRLGPDRQPHTDDDGYFNSADDLSKASTLRASAQELLREEGKFTSRHFRLISQASVRKDAPGVRLWAIISRTDKGVQLIFLKRF